VLHKKHKRCVQSVGKKTENFKKIIKAVKKEVIVNIHTVKDHQKKAAVLIVKTVAMTVAVAVAAAAKGSGNGRGSGRGSGCCG
jgi:predicted metallo-beta-lactamase superfamily hydrolase